MKMKFVPVLIVAIMAIGVTFAVRGGEVTAMGSQEIQANWALLKNMIGATDAKLAEVDRKVNAVLLCNSKLRFYKPGGAGADSDNCVE